jgi:glycosyltransferase involved in cell wall biosynthesis
MRIAIMHHQLELKGGMETYLFNLVKEFNTQQDEVTAFIYKKCLMQDPPCSVKKTNLSFLPRSWRKLWFGWQLPKQKALRSFDLRMSCMRAIQQDIIICGGTHRGYLHHTQKQLGLLDTLEIQLEQRSYDTASAIVAHSELLKKELITLYRVPENKIFKLHPPVDDKHFHQNYRNQKMSLREKYKIDPNKTAIFFPSTGHKRKGFYLLVEALQKLPQNEFELVVAGNKPPHNNSLQNCVYVGFVKDMAQLYTACDMMVLPSLYEPFGLVAVESIQCGTPIIISKYVGAKDLVSEEEGIVLEELTPIAIAQAILKIQQSKLDIKADFVLRKQLTVADHVHKIKKIATIQH